MSTRTDNHDKAPLPTPRPGPGDGRGEPDRRGRGRHGFTVLPTTWGGWTALAMLVLGLLAASVAPLFTAGSAAASDAQNLAVRWGTLVAGGSGLVAALAAWRSRERSLPLLVLCGTATLGVVLLVVSVLTRQPL